MRINILNIALFLVVMQVLALTQLSASEERLVVGDTAIDFPQDRTWYAGSPVSLSENKGKKVTLIYFMKPGCGSCDKLAPHLYRLILKNKDDLSVIGVTEYPDDKIVEYLAKRLGEYPIMRDPERKFMDKYIGKINKYPYMAIIDREGKLAWFGRGKFHAQITAELNKVLHGKEPEAEKAFLPEKMSALVVGVDKSDLVPAALTTAVNNAELVGTALEEAGYNDIKVLTGSDATAMAFNDSVREFAGAATEKDAALFYFSGEAMPENTIDGIDLKLYLKDATVSLKKVINDYKAESKCDNIFVIIDANNENSHFDVWENIAPDMEKTATGATVMLSAARWDRSLIGNNPETTVFTEELAHIIKGNIDSKEELTPVILWSGLRDSMSALSRETGVLQSPFIINKKAFNLLPNK